MGLVDRPSGGERGCRLVPHEQVAAAVGVSFRSIAGAIPRIAEHRIAAIKRIEHLLHVGVLHLPRDVAVIAVPMLHPRPFVDRKLCYPGWLAVALLKALGAGEDL